LAKEPPPNQKRLGKKETEEFSGMAMRLPFIFCFLIVKGSPIPFI